MLLDIMTVIGDGSGSGDGSSIVLLAVFLLAVVALSTATDFVHKVLEGFVRKLLGSVAILAILAGGSTASAQHGVCHVPAATYHPPAQQVIHGHGHGYGHGYYFPPFPLVAFYPYADRAYSAPPTAAQIQATDDLKELRTAMVEQAKALAALAEAVSKLKTK